MCAWLVRGLIALVASVAAAAVITGPVAALESGASTQGLIYDATVDVAPGPIVDSPGFVAPAEQFGSGGVEPAGISTHVFDWPASLVAPSSSAVVRTADGAANAANGARLAEQFRLTERYGSAGVRELADGRMRFYGELTARTPGEMVGARLVREWNPATGAQRTWYETLDHAGNVRSVRPETGGSKIHYIFDAAGFFTGSR